MDNNAINKNMEENIQEKSQLEKKPDERGGILIQSHLKIFDPETKEVYMDGRA